MQHHFTSPYEEDLELFRTDPGKVRAKAYDLVINGVEIGGGSIRIHDEGLQKQMFDNLGFSKEEADSVAFDLSFEHNYEGHPEECGYSEISVLSFMEMMESPVEMVL